MAQDSSWDRATRDGKNYDINCAVCHGTSGEGLKHRNCWGDMQSEGPPQEQWGLAYASTLFDFIRRAMPATAPKSLTNQQVYDVTYILYMNGIVDEDTPINGETIQN